MGTQEKKRKKRWLFSLSPTQCAQFRVEIQNRGINANPPLGICVAEKLLSLTILSFLLYKMGVVITFSSCDYYEDKNERTYRAEPRSWRTVKPSIHQGLLCFIIIWNASLLCKGHILLFP